MNGATRQSSSALADVVRLRPFRRLWLVFGLSSVGAWLGLLATSSFASAQLSSSVAQGAAFGGVIAVQLLPWLILGPIAGFLADRFDRRHTMVVADLARFALFASIPLVAQALPGRAAAVAWAAAASFLAQAAAMIWTPAKEAAVPNLLPRERLETANQLTIITTYGIAPVLAALVFAAAGRLPGAGLVDASAVALYFDALTFLASAAVVALGVPEISGRGGGTSRESVRDAARTGWRFVAGSRLMRGLTTGLVGAFAGAGMVAGAAKFYARTLGGGDSTFGLLFGGLFVGFGLGVAVAPALLGELSRRRAFCLAVMLAGLAVVALAAMPRTGAALVVVLMVGLGAGAALLHGVTILGAEVPDQVRGRVVAFVQTSARVVLLLSVAGASAVAGAGPELVVTSSRLLLILAGLCAVGAGLIALRQMDDRRGVPLLTDLRDVLRRHR